MKTTKLFSTIFLFILSLNISAQEIITANIDEALPKEVLDAINNETDITTVFSVGTNEHFNGQIIRSNEIVFSENAHLIIDNIDFPWIVIIADKIKFQNPNKTAKITFAKANLTTPNQASKGDNGGNASGRSGRHGNPGGHGQSGKTGYKGITKQLPHIYIITKELTSPSGTPAFAPLAILGNGIQGGQGGQGGNGGNGGNGYSGLKAAPGIPDCRRGGGNGGNGGNAGKGGKGGDGGDGGNGVSLTVISTSTVNNSFSYVQLLNTGGFGGPGGVPGNHGGIGSGGEKGRGKGNCGGGSGGSNGKIPSPRNLGYGNEGKVGNKGKFVLVTASNLNTLF